MLYFQLSYTDIQACNILNFPFNFYITCITFERVHFIFLCSSNQRKKNTISVYALSPLRAPGVNIHLPTPFVVWRRCNRVHTKLK